MGLPVWFLCFLCSDLAVILLSLRLVLGLELPHLTCVGSWTLLMSHNPCVWEGHIMMTFTRTLLLYLCVSLQEIVEHIDRDGKVPCAKRVGPIPSLRPELPSFGNHRVKVTESKEDALELCLPGTHFQSVLEEKHH